MLGHKKIFIYYLANLLASGKFEKTNDIKLNINKGRIVEYLFDKYPVNWVETDVLFTELNKEIKEYDFFSIEKCGLSEDDNGLLLLLDLIVNFL